MVCTSAIPIWRHIPAICDTPNLTRDPLAIATAYGAVRKTHRPSVCPCVTALLLISLFSGAESRCQSVLTMSTAQEAPCDTELGTLPMKRRVPCIPLLPTTTRSAATSSATSRIALTASPFTA